MIKSRAMVLYPIYTLESAGILKKKKKSDQGNKNF